MKFEKLGAITKNLDSRRIPLNSEERIAKSKEGLYPYIGANNVVDYIDEYIFDEKILCVAEDGGSWGANQQCAVIYEGKTWVNNHAHVLTENGKASLEYIKNYLNYANLNKYIKGATRGKLNKSVLENIPIPYPSLPDQLHIANILSKAENLIAQRKESIRLMDEFLKITFLEMFGDPAFNTKNYEKAKFKDLIAKGDKINYGIVQPGEDGKKEGVAIIRVGDFDGIRINGNNLKLVDPAIEQKHKASRLVGDELLIACVGATIGKIALTDVSHAGKNIVRAIARIRCDSEKINRLYLCQLLLTEFYQFNLKNLARTIAQPTLNIGQIEELKIIVPPIELQTQFAQSVKKIEALKTQYQQSLQELENLYGSLSQKAFRGELSVNLLTT